MRYFIVVKFCVRVRSLVCVRMLHVLITIVVDFDIMLYINSSYVAKYRGAFAMVRVSTHNKLKKKFAIKEVYTKDLSNDQLSDLDKEICILSQMRHSNICGIHEVYKTPNHTYLVSFFQ